jgi:hypothetical protein
MPRVKASTAIATASRANKTSKVTKSTKTTKTNDMPKAKAVKPKERGSVKKKKGTQSHNTLQ